MRLDGLALIGRKNLIVMQFDGLALWPGNLINIFCDLDTEHVISAVFPMINLSVWHDYVYVYNK